MEASTQPVTFSVAELWLLHAFVRHEMAQQEQWKSPPVSLALNEQISDALLGCHRHHITESTLLITAHDCLVIDYLIRSDMKSPEGAAGIAILLKTFAARAALNGDLPDAVESDSAYGEAIQARHHPQEG